MSKSTNEKSSALKRAEVNLHAKSNKYLLARYQHHYIPGLNFNKNPWVKQWNYKNVMSLYRKFPYICDLPKPLLPPVKLTKSVLADGDPATDILATKNYIENDINRILDNYQKHLDDHTAQLKKDLNWMNENNKLETKLPRYIADLADIIEMDPDKHFEGKYNWYYSGGTLDSVAFGGETLLLFPYVGEFAAVPVCIKDNYIWKPTFRNAAKCSIDDTLYELRHNVTTESCRILARFKNECILYSITKHNDGLNMSELDCRKSKFPYLSADLHSFDFNQYCTLQIGRLIEFWDMVSGKCLSKNRVKSTKTFDDGWGCIRYQAFNPNIVTFTDRCCLHYIDLRESWEKPVLSICPKSHLENCDYISLCVQSNRESRYYFGTTHSLLMCDDRSPEKSILQKWTHQFKSPPLLGSTLMLSGQEFILISSQVPSDTAIILNTWENYDNPHSYNLPHKPPHMSDTLRECQLLGKCLDPSLRSRLELSIVGSKLLINDSQNVFIFSQNSIGDVFYQCITHEEFMDNLPLINSHAFYALETWEHHMLEQDRSIAPIVVTDQVNMKYAFDAISTIKLKYEPKPPVEIVLDSWKQSLDRLSSYVDILAPELLPAWEIPGESEHIPHAAPHQKVLNWLEVSSPKFSITQTQESQGESFIPLTPVLSQELVSVSQQCRDVEVIEELHHELVKRKTNRKEPKKKSDYVAGF